MSCGTCSRMINVEGYNSHFRSFLGSRHESAHNSCEAGTGFVGSYNASRQVETSNRGRLKPQNAHKFAYFGWRKDKNLGVSWSSFEARNGQASPRWYPWLRVWILEEKGTGFGTIELLDGQNRRLLCFVILKCPTASAPRYLCGHIVWVKDHYMQFLPVLVPELLKPLNCCLYILRLVVHEVASIHKSC